MIILNKNNILARYLLSIFEISSNWRLVRGKCLFLKDIQLTIRKLILSVLNSNQSTSYTGTSRPFVPGRKLSCRTNIQVTSKQVSDFYAVQYFV